MEVSPTSTPNHGTYSPADWSTAPFETTEVRWFANGSMPRALVNWFTLSGRRGTLEVRYDTYLMANSPDLGQKYRNHGPFEIKTRRSVGAELSLDDRLTGRTEEWSKVKAGPPPITVPRNRWFEVHKVVLTRTYHTTARNDAVEVTFGDISAPGCDIELAAVSVAEISAWTFGLEAWGPPNVRPQMLDQAADAFLQATGLPESVTSALTIDMGYPEWLSTTVWQDRTPPRD